MKRLIGAIAPPRRRRFVLIGLALVVVSGFSVADYFTYRQQAGNVTTANTLSATDIAESDNLIRAEEALGELVVRERDFSEEYVREQFGAELDTVLGCDMRNRILQRDLAEVEADEGGCKVVAGVLESGPFTGKRIPFRRGPETSQKIHIEHIVALSDAWHKGAHTLDKGKRHRFFNDPLNLIAVEGAANMDKGNADASEWLPPNETYHCRYIARQIAVKHKYDLWVVPQEHAAMKRVLKTCPLQVLPVESHASSHP